MRISTWAAITAFVLLALIRRDRRVLLTGWVWLFGFEAAYQATVLLFGRPMPSMRWGPFVLLALGIATVSWLHRRGIRPHTPLMLVAAAIWVVWVATGFHVNQHTGTDFSWVAEALNESAKTAWALAYLLPLLSWSGSSPRGDRGFVATR